MLMFNFQLLRNLLHTFTAIVYPYVRFQKPFLNNQTFTAYFANQALRIESATQ